MNKIVMNNTIIKRSITAFILFIIIIIANVIIYPLSLRDDYLSGANWFFFVMLPSIPLLCISSVLACLSLTECFKKSNQNKGSSKLVCVIISFIQLILTFSGLIYLIIYLTD